jgi:hypothetical protein
MFLFMGAVNLMRPLRNQTIFSRYSFPSRVVTDNGNKTSYKSENKCLREMKREKRPLQRMRYFLLR